MNLSIGRELPLAVPSGQKAPLGSKRFPQRQTMAEQIIKTATASDEASTIAVMVLAFSADPAARWTWPDPQQYLRHFPSFIKALGGKAFAHGSAYYVDGYAGAAMWLPPEVSPDEDALVDLLQQTGYAPVQKDVLQCSNRWRTTTRRSRIGSCRSSGSIRFNRAKGSARP